MKTYGARVRVPNASGSGMVSEWAQVQASNPISARNLLVALYGRGTVVGIPVLVT
jgi:hypothetical protein